MRRRDGFQTALFILAALAVLAALVVFKVRVFVAGGKLVLALAAILAVVWLLTRGRPRD